MMPCYLAISSDKRALLIADRVAREGSRCSKTPTIEYFWSPAKFRLTDRSAVGESSQAMVRARALIKVNHSPHRPPTKRGTKHALNFRNSVICSGKY